MENRPAYDVETRCPKCGKLLAPSGGMQAGMVLAQPAECPECGTCVLVPCAIPFNLLITPKALEELVRMLAVIQSNDGWGRLIVDFQRGTTARVGLGESLRDVR
jgi:ribosomal protein S27AE